jgi:Ca2+-binding RTX toxin-like protein
MALAVVLAPTTAAHATTVQLDSRRAPHPRAGEIVSATLTVGAASGERNDLTIRWDADPSAPAQAAITVTDVTAPLHPGPGCVAAATGGVVCPVIRGAWLNAKVDLGDGDDRLAAIAIPAFVNGGPGDDRLDARHAAGAQLHGGDGADVLLGGINQDELTGGAGADAISGGEGFDTVSYTDHATGVSVRLGGSTDDGAPGEGDSIADDVERAVGSAGNDVIVGSDRSDQLVGGGGDDRLEGLGGDDQIIGGDAPLDEAPSGPSGADAVFGGDGDGDDELSAAGRGSRLDGGAGADRLTAVGAVVVSPGPGADHVLAGQSGAAIDTRESDGADRDLVRCTGAAHLISLGDGDLATGCGRHVRQDRPRAIALLDAQGNDEHLWLFNLHAFCADVSRPRCAVRLSLRDESNGRVMAASRRTLRPGAGVLLKLPVPRKFVRRRDRIVNYVVSTRAPSGEVQTLRWPAWIPGGSAVPTDRPSP